VDRRSRTYFAAVAAYLGTALLLATYHHLNTEVGPAAISCAPFPAGLELLLGPMSMTECAFSNYRRLGVFIVVSAGFLALFALATWASRRWVRALAVSMAVVMWLVIGLIASVSLFAVLV
jgi:hypothetical protein